MILYILQAVALLAFAIAIVCYFSHESTPIYVRCLVALSFTLSFSCFLVLPMDIYETSVHSNFGKGVRLLWTIIYDINAFLCWLVLPLVQEYEDSGEFSKVGKFKEAVRNNAILIGGILAGATTLIVYLLITGKFTFSQIPNVLATIVNLFGLALVSTMLGFGLVSFPKENYTKIDYRKRVNKCHRMAESLRSDQQLIKEEVQEIQKLLMRRQREGGNCHEQEVLDLIDRSFDFSQFRSYADPMPSLEGKKIYELHTLVKKRIIEHNACEDELDELVDELRDVTINFSKNNYQYMKYLYALLLILTVLLSVIIFWGEFSIFISIFSYINVLRLIDWGSPAAYILNCLLVFYIAYIVTHTVFRLKVYKMFSLHKRHSSSSSLAFTAINLARISFPLCYNYLQITDIKEAQFLVFFGDITFNTKYAFVFPVIMILFALFNILDVYDSIMGFFGVGMYAFDEDDAQEKAQEGQKILMEKLRERNIETHKMEMIQLL